MLIAASIRTLRPRTRSRHRPPIAAPWCAYRSATRARCALRFASVAPDANPYLALYSIFKTGIDGNTAKIKNLRQAERYLPDHIQRPSTTSRGRSGSPRSGRRCAGPVCRPEAGRRRPLRARTWHLRQGPRSAVPPRGLQPVALEPVLERTSHPLIDTQKGAASDGRAFSAFG